MLPNRVQLVSFNRSSYLPRSRSAAYVVAHNICASVRRDPPDRRLAGPETTSTAHSSPMLGSGRNEDAQQNPYPPRRHGEHRPGADRLRCQQFKQRGHGEQLRFLVRAGRPAAPAARSASSCRRPPPRPAGRRFDKPMLQAALTAQGFEADIQNAQGDDQKFSTLADGMHQLSGVKVLVIAPADRGRRCRRRGRRPRPQGIPVIDYDRLNLGGSRRLLRLVRQREGRPAAGPGPGGRAEEQAGRAGHPDRGRPDRQQRHAVHQGPGARSSSRCTTAGTLKLVKKPADRRLGQPDRRHDVRADPAPPTAARSTASLAANDGLAGAVITMLQEERPQRQGPGHRPGRHRRRPDGHHARRPVHDGLQADQAGGRGHRQAGRRPGQGRHRRRGRDRDGQARTTRRATATSSPCCSRRTTILAKDKSRPSSTQGYVKAARSAVATSPPSAARSASPEPPAPPMNSRAGTRTPTARPGPVPTRPKRGGTGHAQIRRDAIHE